MRPPVASEIRRVNVALLTERTLERSLFGVRPNMTIEPGHGDKRFGAHFALKRSNSGVRSNVELQVLFARESLAAVIALEFLFVDVRSSVGSDRFMIYANSTADITGNSLLQMNHVLIANVSIKSPLRRERVCTIIAVQIVVVRFVLLLHVLFERRSIR